MLPRNPHGKQGPNGLNGVQINQPCHQQNCGIGQLRTESTIYPRRQDCTPSPQTPAFVKHETKPSSRQDQGQTIRAKRPFKKKNKAYQRYIHLSHNVYYVNFKKYPDRQLSPGAPFSVPKAIGTTQTAYLHFLPLIS